MTIAKKIWELVFAGDQSRAIAESNKSRNPSKSPVQTGGENSNIVLFDPSLSLASGHQMGITQAYEELFTAAGCRLTVKHAYNLSIPERENWQPYFVVPHHTLAFQAISSAKELTNVNEYFEYEIAQVINSLRPEICVIATARFTNIVGAVNAIAAYQRSHTPAVIFTVFEADDAPDCNDSRLIRSAFMEAANILNDREISYRISVETAYIRNFLVACGFKSECVSIYEYVAANQITSDVGFSSLIDEKIRVGYVGGSRPTRNPELIADLIMQHPLNEKFRWCVQFDLNYIEQQRGTEVVQKLVHLKRQGLIEMYECNLSQPEYNALFCSLDFLILPYSQRYQKIGSGILNEAIYAEVIPVFPKSSTLNELYRSLGGNVPSFDSLSLEDLYTAVLEGIERRAELKQSAVQIKKRWHGHPHSTANWSIELSDWILTVLNRND
jgi:hypothetical protein